MPVFLDTKDANIKIGHITQNYNTDESLNFEENYMKKNLMLIVVLLSCSTALGGLNFTDYAAGSSV